MPMVSAQLRPGVNTMMTPALNEAGVSQSNLIRYQQGMIQKYGGWSQYYPVAIGSTIRDLHGWEGLTSRPYLGIGATHSLSVIIQGANTDITPQTRTTDFAPNFSVSSGSNIVTIIDAGSSASVYSSIFFNTPVSVGGIFLNGGYRINASLGSSAYNIIASTISSVSVVSSGILPQFNTIANSGNVTVVLPNNNFQAINGIYQQFIAPTTVGGITIQGPYQIQTVIDSTSFKIGVASLPSSTTSAYMNNGNAEIVYYYTQGPLALSGYGVGGYGDAGYGTGAAAPAGTGTPITTTDWSMDNWGEALLSCPHNGPIYQWAPNSGLTNSQVVQTAPFFNGGIYVSMPQQILVAWASCQDSGVQDPLLVKWSDALDFTNWTPTSQNFAGSFRLPTGSIIRGGLQSATQGIIWTDIDVWVQQYVGQPLVFSHNRVGSGCGLVGQHAAGILGGNVYWMSNNNFFVINNTGVQILPCSVWNFVFQNIDTANMWKVRCSPNSLFNEITWFFPQLNGTGENTLYVKFNIAENEWDYGSLGRSAWIDATVLGNPIGAEPMTGIIYQHETTNDAGGIAMEPLFESGYWAINEGNDLAFVDWVIPDMQYSTYNQLLSTPANLSVTLSAVDYPGDIPRTYGPYPYNQQTGYINTRLRGRFMAITVTSSDMNSFWRLGRVKYRWAPVGRR